MFQKLRLCRVLRSLDLMFFYIAFYTVFQWFVKRWQVFMVIEENVKVEKGIYRYSDCYDKVRSYIVLEMVSELLPPRFTSNFRVSELLLRFYDL